MFDCLTYDLLKNNFSRTESLGRVLESVPSAREMLERLRRAEAYNHSLVVRCKHSGAYRYGSDLSASTHDQYLSQFESIRRLYSATCGSHLGQTTFSPLLPVGHVAPCDPYEAHQLWLNQIQVNSEKYGDWTIFIDIENFYPSITTRRLASIVENELGIDVFPYFRLFQVLDDLGGRPPQGYFASDLLAAVALSPLDRYIVEHRIGACHFSDDIAVSGPSQAECVDVVGDIQEFLARLGFQTNARKLCVEPPSHLPWVVHGDRWGSFPVEDYLSRPNEQRHKSRNPSPEMDSEDVQEEAVEEGFEAIYTRYSEPPKTPESEHIHRQTVRPVAALNPVRILRDAESLTYSRTSDIKLILKALKNDEERALASYRCRAMRGNDGAEDAVATILEHIPEKYREQFVPKIVKNAIRTNALRRALLDHCPRNAWSVDYFFERLPSSVSLADAVAYQRFAVETGGRDGKHLSATISNLNASLGVVREIVEDALACGAFTA